ncbi:autotransporter domain-containing protein [Bosea sp. BK604]|uniref:autotransporter domain-containing protein n=1 Tax=Bosea sp. BK604 TaxID=2512180 RepID=UPI001404D9D4|nr:autotransporter domain-containing protein [Bosea sp. BK604]
MLASVSAAALACWLPCAALAADFTAGTDQQFRDAIAAANASPDASSTIRLTGSFAISGASITALTKPITIDTQGFTLSGTDGTGAIGLNIVAAVPGGNPVTFFGTLRGADSAAAVAAQVGMGNQRIGLINNGTIAGGNGTSNNVLNGGGAGIRFNNPNAPIINNGTIQGGNSIAGSGGAGVDLAGTIVPATLENNGTIRGGNGPANGANSAGVGVISRIGVSQITNNGPGVIEGGAGAFAITSIGNTANINLINSGIIRAGAGQDTAITLASTATTGVINLELRDGSQIFGNVIGNATALTDSLTLSGTGSNSLDISQYRNFDSFQKTGTGTWTLTGAGVGAMPWVVQQGTLLVNGTTTGDIGVLPTGTIGGSGTINGNVQLSPGAASLNPGGALSTPGTLTINGALLMGPGSSLNFEVGQIGTGPLNDLLNINGDLTPTLGAVVNVATTPGGTSDPGLYRLINYTGAFLGSLTLGSAPSPDFSLQTVVPGQINLINTGGLVLRFWDGPAGHGDNLIGGGTGIWQDSTGNSNWTLPDGSVNAPYPTGAFAVFQGTPGTVTVDTTGGPVVAAGMQFLVDNYIIQGGDITLLGPQATIRVGDGTAASSGYFARIASNLTGNTQLVKADLGSLILSGENTYTGGTLISGGTLVIGDGGTTGSIVGDVTNNNALVFNRSNAMTFDGVISGSGFVAQAGTGTTTLTGVNTYSGGTVIGLGTLIGSATSFGSGGIGNNSALVIDQPSDASFANAISGTGSFTKRGAGTLALTGANTYAGGTTIEAGTLQLGAGGMAGSITGDVVNNGTLAFNRSDTVTFTGAISGSGALRQDGSGTVILTGANSYGGGTTIAAGTLQIGNGGTDGSISGDVVNNGTLAVNRTNIVSLSGAISGSGALQQIGTGTTVLTGANTYTGGTTIAAGTLQLGNGGTTGSIIGDVVNNGTLEIQRTGALTLAGAISGTGGVALNGAVTLTLTGANTYRGGTQIVNGTVIGSATSFGSGSISNFGNLIIDQPTDATLVNAINGNGTFTKRGAGNLNFTGGGGLFGPTTVEAGKLSVNNAFTFSPVTVLSGAALGGNGTVGTTTVQSGATIAPGNSIGTLNVNGNLTLAPGSTYEVELAGNGTSDRIAVTGIATASGSQVGVSALDPQTSYINGQRYTILTATGGVAGSAPGAVSRSAFLDLTVDKQPNQVDLVIAVKGTPPVTPPTDPVTPTDPGTPPVTPPVTPPAPPPLVFQTVAQTGNQYATALALNSLPQVGGTLALYNSLLVLDAPTARAAFDALSGDAHASAKTALVEESWLLRNAMNDRLRSAFGGVGAAPMATMSYGFTADLAPAVKGPMPRLAPAERFAVWGQGYGAWGRTDTDRNAAKLTRSTGGFLVGADVAVFDTMRVGLLAGYSRSEFDAKGRLSSGESDNYHLGLYGGGQWGALSLRTGASYTWHEIDTSRIVAFPGFGNSLRADYNAGTAQVFGELGYRFDVGQVALEPFAGLAYVNLHTDGFNEIGGAAALNGRSDDTSLGYSTLGLRASTSFALSGMDLTLRGGLAWRHAFGHVDPAATLAFAGSGAFTVAGLPIARDAALVEAGLDLAISKSATLGVSYTGQLAQDAQDHAFKANLAWKF